MTTPLKEIIRETLEAYVELGADDADLGLDSLSIVQLVEELEEKLGFVMRAAEMKRESFRSVNDIVSLVTRLSP